MISKEILKYCSNWVKYSINMPHVVKKFRRYDREEWLCSMLMSGREQAIYLILRAWQIELNRTRTPAALNNPAIVAGKFAFWREVVNMEQRNTGHPIAAGLQELLGELGWPKDRILTIIAAKAPVRCDISFKIL